MKALCSICLEDLTDNSTLVALPCGHVFDEICILECYQRSQKCPNCKAQHDERSTQLYRRLYFSNNGESRTDADQVLIQSLKAKVERLETNLKNNTSFLTRSDMYGQLAKLYSDYEAKDSELIEAVSKLSLVTAANEKLEESNLTLKSSLLKTRNAMVAAKSDKDRLTKQLDAALNQINNLRIPLTREQNRSVTDDAQNAAWIRKERQLAKAEGELAAQRSRIADLEAKCKVLADSNSNLQERQNALASSSSSQRRPNISHARIYEHRIMALETELASIKTQRNRHHREATKQKKKVDNLEKQTEEMAQVIGILDTLIEKGSLHILNQPSSSRNQARANPRSAYRGWI